MRRLIAIFLLFACTPANSDVTSVKPPTAKPQTGKPRPMTDAQIEESARKALGAGGVANPAGLKHAPGPGWMFDPAATAPFVFHTFIGEPGEPGDPEEQYLVAVDTTDGRGYYKDPKGLETFLRAVGYPAKRKLTADEVLAAWQVLSDGAAPMIARPENIGDPQLKAKVTAPATTTAADGSAVTVGWTRGNPPTRRTIGVAKDGKVTVTSVSAKDL
jgi:hypothetical protein